MSKEPEIFDFGFSLEDSETLKSTAKEGLVDKLEELQAMYEPLLKNLEKDPDKDIIRWPNRSEKIKEFRKRVQAFIDKAHKDLS